jgi:hypothetical protein
MDFIMTMSENATPPGGQTVYCTKNSKRILYNTVSHPDIAMRLRHGEEERGCGYRVKEARIYVQLHLQLQLQSTSSSRPTVRSRP